VKTRIFILTFLSFLLIAPSLLAQRGVFRGNYWKQQRKEVLFGIGPSNFLGDLAGKDQIGSDFYQDLEIKSTRYVVNASFRYYVARNISFRASLSYGVVSGNDAFTNEPFRRNRNIHFKSPIIEPAGLFEYHLVKERYGKSFRRRGSRNHNRKFGIMGFAGVGLAYFNPKGKYTDGKWYSLRPLGTEGQGLPGGANNYSNFTVVFPMGFGIKYVLTRQIKIGLNFGLRKTLTDYLDDASTVYYDKEAIRVANGDKGDIAAYLADPSLERNNASGLWQARPGEVRGDDSDKDSYMFGVFNIGYTLRKTSYRRIKRRKGNIPSF